MHEVKLKIKYYNSLRLKSFPTAFKSADVILLPKPGKDPLLAENYRPISLLSSIGKVLEKVVLIRLNEVVDEKAIIPDFQYGFRAAHSTTHQLLRVVEHIVNGFNNKKFTALLSLDVSKAFDRVWHDGLLYKMISLDFPKPLVKLLSSYLSDRSFRVKLNGHLSTERPLDAGVPQGSLLSPLLFNIYCSDLPSPIDRNTHLAQYADDTAILSSSANELLAIIRVQNQACLLETWCRDWRVAINPSKSAATVFTRRKTKTHPNIMMFGEKVPWTSDIKYLGVTLDSKLTWKKHIDSKVNSASNALSALYPMMCRNSKLSTDNKLLIYKAIVRPIMTYAAPVWGYAAKYHINKMQVVQNKALRISLNAPRWIPVRILHKDTKILRVSAFIKSLSTKFYDSLANHSNPTIKNLSEYDLNEPSKHNRPKSVLNRDD